MSLPVQHGSTDQSVEVRVLDSTDGSPEAAFAHDTAGIALWYRREGGAKTTITPAALAALTTAHTDGGVEYISDGYVRIDVPDAAFAAGASSVVIGGSATGMVLVAARVNLVAFDPQDAVRLGLTALPNAAADAAGGLPVSDGGGLDLDALNTAAVRLTAARAQIIDDWANAGRLDAILDTIAEDTTTDIPGTLATIAGYLDTEIAAIKAVTDALPDSGALTTIAADAARLTAARAQVLTDWINGGRLDLILDAIAGDVVNLDGDAMRGTDNAATAASLATHDGKLDTVSTNVTTLLGRITATLFSGITSLAEWLGLMAGDQAADSTALTEIKATGAGSGGYDESTDSLEALAGAGSGGAPTAEQIRTEIDANSTKLDVAVSTRSSHSDPGASPSAASIRAEIDSNSTQLAAIKAKTDNLPSDPADQSLIIEATNGIAALIGTPAGADLAADIAENQADLDAVIVLATAIDDLTKASGDGDLAAVKTATDRVTAARAQVIDDWANAGRLDALLDLVKAKTDLIPATPAAVGSEMALEDGAITDAKLATDTDVYEAKVGLVDDEGSTTDRWAVRWFKNGSPVLTGITTPLIQIVKMADGNDLVASTAMTAVAGGSLRYDEATNRVISGAIYEAVVTATIDGSPRTHREFIGRDSTA